MRKNDDVISRQAAIDVLDKNHILGRGDLNEVLDHIVERLDKLPSAQPDLSEYSDKLWRNAYERGKRDAQPEIIRCKRVDCLCYNDKNDGKRGKKVRTKI